MRNLCHYAKHFLPLILLAGCICFSNKTIYSQYQIESWTTDQGLPQNTVYSLVQTADGYLWLATLDGLVRFDGVRFAVFNKQNTAGIESNRFTQLVVDGQGALWAGTENSGITRYQNGGFQTIPLAPDSVGRPLWKMFINGESELVVFTESEMLIWKNDKFVPYQPIAGEKPENIALWGKSGTFWYADTRTVYRFKNNRIDKFPLPGVLKTIAVNKLFEDSRERLWIGTSNTGLFLLENDNLSAFPLDVALMDNHVSPRIEDSSGNLWVVTNTGIAIIAADGKTSYLKTENGLSGNAAAALYAFNSVLEDREGNIWIGTLYSGLNRLNQKSVTFYTQKDGLTADVINPIYQTQAGDIWIGGKSITHYESGTFNAVSGLGQFPSATSIEQDRSGRIWFGSWDKLFYYENGKFTNFDELENFKRNLDLRAVITDIHEDLSGTKWFASNVGVFRYRKDELQPITRLTTENGLASNDVKIIHESPGGTLWFGTFGGLTKFKDNSFSTFTTADGLSSNLVRSLYEDQENVLWIGSYDGGLTRLKDGKFTRYTSNDGLFNDGVFQILEDERGNLWMSCNRGIYRVAKQMLNDFADGKIARIESVALGKADGLLETECNGGQQPAGIKASDGRLWFPTQKGVAVIDPNAVKINQLAPPVIIESAMIDGENTQINKEIEIAAGKNNFEIAYTGLSFVKPEFVKFRYRLEELQSDWVEAGARRTAYFSYLPPGEYTFKVIAANADGVWNREGKSLKIRVLPAFYRTWWFWILVFAIIISAVFFLHRRRVARLEKEKAAQRNFSYQLIETQEQDRKRIAAELHDGLGQSLVIIKNRALLSLEKRENSDRAFEQLDEIALAASEAIDEVREITYNLRPYQLDRLGLTKAIISMIRRAQGNIEFETEIDDLDGFFPPDIEINIYRIVQESINNIIKHSGAAQVKILLKRFAENIEINIQDDGRGFEPETVKSGFGLLGLSERARMLGGNFSIETAPGKGTKINIRLSLKDARKAT